MFSEELRTQAAPIMTAIHDHAFVRGIADGYVPREALSFTLNKISNILVNLSKFMPMPLQN